MVLRILRLREMRYIQILTYILCIALPKMDSWHSLKIGPLFLLPNKRSISHETLSMTHKEVKTVCCHPVPQSLNICSVEYLGH